MAIQVTARGQGISLESRGYLKNLAIGTSSILTGESQFLNVTRFRWQQMLDVGSNLHAEVWLDTEALAGSFLSSEENAISAAIERRTWLDLDWRIASEYRFVLEQRLFRAFATYYAGKATVTVGRQRIAWGSGFAWNPTDLFNPFNPAAIELDEKSGIDAVHLSVATGDFSHVEAAYAPASAWSASSAAARLVSHVGEYDFSLMGGYFRDDLVVGGDFSGYIGDAGLKGEAALTIPEDGNAYVRLTLTADRSFKGDYYAFVEYYLNGQGTTDKNEYDFRQLLTGSVFNVARDYAAVSVSKAVTPLLAANVYALVNIDDQSALVGPSVTYSLRENMEIGGAVYLFAGKGDTEFGQQKNAYFGYLQIFF
ncbi:MAG: hypothetical protein HKN13_10210 [Rhodothermales bacterium]|nr:hypothetical protein [Rhodothermales bacterium]